MIIIPQTVKDNIDLVSPHWTVGSLPTEHKFSLIKALKNIFRCLLKKENKE